MSDATLTEEDFLQLKADFSGLDAARRTAAIPRLVDFFEWAPEVIHHHVESRLPRSAWYQEQDPTPLPPPLQDQSDTTQRWFPLLRQLYRHHGLYGWDIGKCYLLRYQRHGLTPLLLFELLECFSYFPVTRSLFTQMLEERAEEIAAQLLEWLPSLEDNTLATAISFLGASVETRSRSLAGLFALATPDNPNRMDHITKATTDWLERWELTLDEDELFACLRTLLNQELKAETWPLLFAFLDAWDRHDDATMAIDYADRHIPEAAQQSLQAPSESIDSLLTTSPRQTVRLVRKLALQPGEGALQSSRDLRALLIHPWLRGITDLSLTGHDDVTDWLVPLQQDDPLPPLRALALIDAGLTWDDLAPLWTKPLFPTLRQLTLRNNQLSTTSLTDHQPSPLFTQLTALDLSYNGLGDHDMRALAALPPMPQMQTLDITGSRVTQAGLRALLQQTFAPGCRIVAHVDRLHSSEALIQRAEEKGYTFIGLFAGR